MAAQKPKLTPPSDADQARIRSSRSRRTVPPDKASQRIQTRVLIGVLILLAFLTGVTLAWVMSRPLPPGVPLLGFDRFSPREEAKAQRFAPTPLASPLTDELLPPFALHPSARLSYVPAIMYHDVVALRKEVWFDTSVAELRAHFEAIRAAGVTPITMDQFYNHLRKGDPLPPKAILLTFDDAYLGQYENAYPLLKEYNFPAVYFIQTGFVGRKTSKDHITWEQMQQMQQEGLISFAAHTITHPDLRTLDDAKLLKEIVQPKQLLEEKLGRPILYFAYPAGNRDERVKAAVAAAGFKLSFTMDVGYAGQSPNLLEVRRFNQYQVDSALVGTNTFNAQASSDYPLRVDTPLQVKTEPIARFRLTTIRGGRAATIHAEQRYSVGSLMERYQAPAGINGGFFAIPWINSASNIMIGPVLSANEKVFIPGRPEDNKAIRGRPFVLLGQDRIRFVPFDPDSMNDLASVQQLMPEVSDAFVAGVWLVKNGQFLDRAALESFKHTSAAEISPRAFLGVDQQGLVVAGATGGGVSAEMLARALPDIGIREAVLLDSGYSTSLVHGTEILATGLSRDRLPSRPVPHVILLYDLPKLWAQPQTPPDPTTNPIKKLVDLLPRSQQPQAEPLLQAVLNGKQTLKRGNRGSSVTAIQLGVAKWAASKGLIDLMPSGADGVYGGELAAALGVFSQPIPSPDPLSSPDPSPTITPFSLSSTGISSPLPTPRPPVDPVNAVDAQLLTRLLDQLEQAPSGVLVSRTIPRKPVDLSRKPTTVTQP